MKSLPFSHSLAALCATSIALSLFAAFGGCASVPVSSEPMAVAEAAVQHADTSSTSQYAASELQVATGKLARARQAVNERNYEHAKSLAEEAEVDAQVAESHAQSERSAHAARESQNAARDMNAEINRQTTP